jgi:hypothetical protein
MRATPRIASRCAAAALGLLLGAPACAQAGWPALDVPQGAHVQQVASDLVINGQHSRISRLDMTGSADDLLAFYRTQFGKRVVENRVGTARVIASQQGDRFVTVRVVAPLDGAVQATIIETQVGGGRSHSRVERDTESLLPAGSAVLQSQESIDGAGPALMLMAANRAGLQADRDALVDQLKARGFRVVREDTLDAGGHPALALSLSSATEEASITVTDTGEYRSMLIQRNRRPQ